MDVCQMHHRTKQTTESRFVPSNHCIIHLTLFDLYVSTSNFAADDSDSDEDVPAPKTNKANGEERRTSRRRAEASPPSNQRLSSTRRRGGNDLLLDNVAIQSLIEEVAKHACSYAFMRPVKANDAPDYHKIIKNPMDMGKIKSNTNMGRYSSNYEVMKDIQLIFENCDLYNARDSEIHE